jgi:hypothetical protein
MKGQSFQSRFLKPIQQLNSIGAPPILGQRLSRYRSGHIVLYDLAPPDPKADVLFNLGFLAAISKHLLQIGKVDRQFWNRILIKDERKAMTTSTLSPQLHDSLELSIQPRLEGMIDDFMASLPTPSQLTSDQRRGIIARYTAVLEGNFIYWMTATLLAVKAEDARPIILDNLREEVGDSHPVMLRKFAIAANAFPTDTDAFAVNQDLTNVRLFLGRLSGVGSVLAMAFFEGTIQKFMSYLADLAAAQGSTDLEYTDVHGVCDVAHTQGLITATSAELEISPLKPGEDLFEGAYLLRNLFQTIVFGPVGELAA